MKSKLKKFQTKKEVKVLTTNQQEKVRGKNGSAMLLMPFQTSGGD